MDSTTLGRLASDPGAFRDALVLDDGRPWQRDDWQEQFFLATDPGWQRAIGQPTIGGYSRAWSVRPRGHAKTSDIATMITWALLAARRPVRGVVAAGDTDQARLVADAVGRIVRSNDWLRPFVEVQRGKVVNTHTGGECAVLSSDVATSYGLLLDFIVCDELPCWPRRELWDSLFSAAAKKPDCLLAVLGNAGFLDSWQGSLWRAVSNDPAWHCHTLPGPVASWISIERLAEQKRLLPAIAYDRLWANVWTSGSGDALAEFDIAAAVRLRGPACGAKPGRVYLAGLDIGLARDATALAIVSKQVGETRLERAVERPVVPHALEAAIDMGLIPAPPPPEEEHVVTIPATGKLRLTDLTLWRPSQGQRVRLADVERAILSAHERFDLAAVLYDPHQAEHLAERLAGEGVPMVRVPFTGAALAGMASSLLDAFVSRTLALYDHAQLLSDLRSLRVEEKSYGIRLASPRGPRGHGDAATALALAVYGCREFVDPAGDVFVDGPLVYGSHILGRRDD